MTVQAQLLATAFGRADRTGSADAAQTMRMFLIPMGDFTYTTLSGNSYLQTGPPTPGQPGRPQVTVTGGVVTVAWTPPATGTATQSVTASGSCGTVLHLPARLSPLGSRPTSAVGHFLRAHTNSLSQRWRMA